MFEAWYATAMLALEAQKVVELRLVRLAWGGVDGQMEAQRMVNEKIGAAIEATGTLLAGGSPERVIDRYREHVRDNVRRLSLP
ncbi:hypothetical protein OPKNFCMD_3355 [Methylobacterium crusticola]|uniref:Uncharacterized protein n=1 Tax=Methylobacterium crusticola TaxID=1697972 RepID=A0ABQ4QZL1_9HYPH|nr:hypothetical protein [Methylobacterium crusticola]GJD50612.1 hypothetical protein OPKNFCMD_3355 [Methylobacterium crusticola]